MDASVQLYIAVATALLLVMVVFVAVFVAFYQRKQAQQQLAIKAMEERHQRELMAATLVGQEDERKRLAQELHDEIGTMLSVTKISLGQLERQFEVVSPLRALSEKTRALLNETMSNVRRISRNLVPVTLERFGLLVAMQELAEKASESNVRVLIDCPTPPVNLNPAIELMLFRIGQELINNAIKHANATDIRLTLHCPPDSIQLSVTDNGQGFDLTTIRADPKRGLGLRNIESRLSVVRGQLIFDVAPGRGSQIHIRVNVPRPKHAPVPA